jgi:hypothetical protein
MGGVVNESGWRHRRDPPHSVRNSHVKEQGGFRQSALPLAAALDRRAVEPAAPTDRADAQFMRRRMQLVARRLATAFALPRVRSIATRHTPKEPTMISRLSTIAATVAVLAAASLTFAAGAHQDALAVQAAAKSVRIVQLERVVVIAKRLPQAAR